MFSVSKRTVTLLLVMSAAIYLAYRWNHWDDTVSEDIYIGKPLYSPDQKHKAIVFSASGGGAISPYCFDYVSVVPASLEVERSIKRKFRVYEGGCHSLGFSFLDGKPPALENAPLLKWNSSTEIELTFDRNQAVRGINKFLFVTEADEGRIKVTQRNYPQ